MMKRGRLECCAFGALLCGLVCIAVAADPLPVQPPDLEELRSLPRLRKPHYSVQLHAEIRKDPAAMSEFVRITRVCSVHPFWTPDSQVDTCIELCVEHGAELAIYYSPLLRRFNEARAAADAAGEVFDAFALTLEVDGKFTDEVARYFAAVARISAKAKERNVFVGALVLDQEEMLVSDVTAGVVVWKQKMFEAVAGVLVPEAEVIWYGRGGFGEYATSTGWRVFPFTSMEVPGTCVTVPLYWLTETIHWRTAVQRTHALHPTERIIPYVSIGWQWTRDRPRGRKGCWSFPTEASYRIGAEINRRWFGDHPDRFLPNHEIPAVVLYWTKKFPPEFWAHFAAYVNGATGRD